jgi:prolipoprotein diacylglyceryltransferase
MVIMEYQQINAFGMSYPEGMVSTLSARNTELVGYFQQLFPGRPIPEDIIVHPTPVYETLTAFLFFGILWILRKKDFGMGQLFGVYLILAGIERFFVEFLRMNPTISGIISSSVDFSRTRNHRFDRISSKEIHLIQTYDFSKYNFSHPSS